VQKPIIMDISIKKPCHENWDTFTPNEQGAFCGKCVKTVIDFSDKSIEEIKEFFNGKENEKVCGRFESTQLTSLSFDAFFNEFKGFAFTKRFAVILYFTFGMWLFNSNSVSAQNAAHTKGDVEVTVKPTTSIMGGIRAVSTTADSTELTRPEKENILLKGKVKCVTPIEKRNQTLGEVSAVPEKKKAPPTKKAKPKNK
jgi:hypothetical protein